MSTTVVYSGSPRYSSALRTSLLNILLVSLALQIVIVTTRETLHDRRIFLTVHICSSTCYSTHLSRVVGLATIDE